LVYTESMSDEKPKKPSEPDAPACPPKPRKEIPLVSVPNDRDMIAEEMADLFDEDKVTHKHGGTEPEAD
jgi:hypothetical protein